MVESPLKRIWNALKPPPAVPRRAPAHAPLTDPPSLKRFWLAIKPPPSIKRPEQGLSKEEKLARRKTLLRGGAAVAVVGAGLGTYLYISSAPARAEKVFQDGMLLMGKGDYQGAEERFTRAVDIWPQLASGFLERGLARRALNQADGAVQDFDHSIALDSKMGPAHTALGVVYRDRGDLARAVSEFTLSIEIASNTDALYQRGQLYEAQGQHEKALTDYDAAIHQQPDAPYVYQARAMARASLGDTDGAEQDRTQAARLEHR